MLVTLSLADGDKFLRIVIFQMSFETRLTGDLSIQVWSHRIVKYSWARKVMSSINMTMPERSIETFCVLSLEGASLSLFRRD